MTVWTMAWRIDEPVVRGEIDNRERGRLTGRIWFLGRAEPVELNLQGNAWRDVAGRLLRFENPSPQPMDLSELRVEQTGVTGDVTASRKVKVPEISPEEMGEYYRAKKPFPWHWGNSLHLEWYSQQNGRVVIESAAYILTLEGEANWEMSEAEEHAQRGSNAEAMTGFMTRLTEDVAAAEAATDEVESQAWEADQIPTEAEAEAWQARQDILLDRVQARLEREGRAADFERILDEERERQRIEFGEPPPPPDSEMEGPSLAELSAAAEEAWRLNPDPDLEARLDRTHPLVETSHDLWERLHYLADEHGWVPADAQEEHPVAAMITSTMCAGPKLAGALNGDSWPPELEFCASTIVRLKRARSYLDDALLAAESCQEDDLIPPVHLGQLIVDLVDLAHEIDLLIAELRHRLGEAGAG